MLTGLPLLADVLGPPGLALSRGHATGPRNGAWKRCEVWEVAWGADAVRRPHGRRRPGPGGAGGVRRVAPPEPHGVEPRGAPGGRRVVGAGVLRRAVGR